MGNENSQMSGIDIEDKVVEIADFWSQHSAYLPKSQQLSNLTVFIGELFVSGPLWTVHTPLEKSSKNLMIYRHPCILKYISSWSKSSKFYLAVEHVKPLSHEYASLNTLQLCIGLHSILKALCFLHQKGSASHNNICMASIYVTDDGNWKLGGMEYTCKYSELTKDFLNKSRTNRYSAAVDANEEDHIEKPEVSKEFIDTYAFFLLVTELFKAETSGVPFLEDFKKFCKNGLNSVNIEERPKLSDLLKHPFFNHEFIIIHSFLVELPLKSDEEKVMFFLSLASNLRKFEDTLVASQLNGLLLSRMVLLNSIAQNELLPKILCFRQDDELDDEDGPLFSEEVFKKYITPRLIEIFSVRDAQIRLLLLNHFKNYVHAFSEEELQSYILPELLVGIKDTNDILVSVTLQALSILVTILGASTVIGGKRAKLFTDGRPTIHSSRKSRHNSKRFDSSIVAEITSLQSEPSLPTSQLIPVVIKNLPERQRPDGEEVDTSTDEIEQSVDEELEWEDWDVHENAVGQNDSTIKNGDNLQLGEAHSDSNDSSVFLNSNLSQVKTNTKNRIQDINELQELDIKNQKTEDVSEDINFFEGMEPAIEKSSKFLINQGSREEGEVNNSNKLNLSISECDQEDGWGEEDWG
ncbi:hypothetical protein HHI36_013701 [Cryptolaemus montrouzieri]|uniref:Protein kinase domain-containing protein n=1 Tax=Cryptolaemus montrouzieri TaxID=559131 RepID=A0ABD2NIV1_9CUCU